MLVYVIDDEKFILKLLERSLVRDSHETMVFESGVDFINDINSLPKPDVLLLDIVMPGLSGIDVYEKLLTLYKDNMPHIIFMSAYDQTGILTKYLRKDGIWFIPKPFGIMELRSVFTEIYAYRKKFKSGAYPATNTDSSFFENHNNRL